MTDRYESPFSARYASEKMQKLFSADTRYITWRKLWVALAEAQMKTGLPITAEQVEELKAHIDDIDYAYEKEEERKLHHDVMAHIHTYGKAAPKAAGIIHLGATSCYVTDNADLIIMRDALLLIRSELVALVKALSGFADRYKALPCLGYTHFQSAQPVSMGKRAGLWLQDVLSDIEEIDFVLDTIKFLGCRGTTGTEASFMELFEGNEAKIDEMNSLIANSFGFNECFTVSGQTYPRKFDSRIMNALSSVAQSVYRMANDIRLLQHDKQLEENFSEHQVGSSAMAYKRNPIHAERICSLARYLMTDALNAHLTASVQWLERTLDDSANRRISLPEGFLCADSIIRLSIDLINHLHVNEKVVAKFLNEYLPFIATENIMMEAVKRGGDRQQVHEIIRSCSMDATAALSRGESADLLKKLAEHTELHLSEDEIRNLADPSLYIGRCPSQVDNLIARANSVIDDSDFTDTDEII